MGKKTCSIFIILFLILFANLRVTLANHTIDDSIISITHSPDPVRVDSGSITITITATRDIFDTNQFYSYNMWEPTKGAKVRCSYLYGVPVKPISPQEIRATSAIKGCGAEVGNWKFELWLGRGNQARSDSSLIIRDYNFPIVQAGGGKLELIPVKTPLGLSEDPQVDLTNARGGNKYELWWDGSKTEWARKFTAPNDGNFTLDLAKNGVDFTTPGTKKLCMEIGDDPVPFSVSGLGVTCRIWTVFEFTAIPPPPSTKPPECSILPPKPAAGDSVSIKAVNLAANQDFRADLVSNGQILALPTKQNSGARGVVSLNLAAHLGAGKYTSIVRDDNDQESCRKDFTVGLAGTPSLPSMTRCTDPTKCSFVGSLPCQGETKPSIKTAIGCIHTNPGDLIVDVLKFGVRIGGGLAFLMMLLGAFQMLTSAGNPETLQAGKDRLTSAVIGLLVIIFSVLLLQIIGVDILGILKR